MGRADATTHRVRCRHWLSTAMAWALLLAAVDATGAPATETREPSAEQRVRPQGEAIRAAVAVGLDRSATFRRLHDAIDASDGMVYVVEGMCRRNVHACLLHTVTVAGPYRVLLIRVDPQKASACELVGVIGHELQHAMEVLSDPTVRNDTAIYWLFERIGKAGSERFETAEALAAGSAIEREVCRAD